MFHGAKQQEAALRDTMTNASSVPWNTELNRRPAGLENPSLSSERARQIDVESSQDLA